MLQKNDLVTVEITDITSEGNGVGHYQGFALFVPDTAVGDTAEIRVVKVLKSYGFGRIERIISPSPTRVEPACPVCRQCGGCSFWHISYEEECRLKNRWIEDSLRRIGGISLDLEPFSPSPQRQRYRNKAQYPVGLDKDGKPVIGFYARRSHRIVPVTDCLLQPKKFTQVLKIIELWIEDAKIPIYNEETHSGLLRHIYLREGKETGELMVCLVVNGDSLPCTDLLVRRLTEGCCDVSAILLNRNTRPGNVILGDCCRVLYGKPAIEDLLCGVRVELSPLAFYQVNHDSAQRLYGFAREFAGLTGEETLLDLFCGAGTIGLSMAGEVKQLVGVEIVPQAVENARKNAAANGIANARFFCADAGAAAKKLVLEGLLPDVVVVDPPRKGCDAAVIEAVAEMGPGRVVMISCNPATMARDCRLFEEKGYQVVRVKGVDLFPRTGHVETVVLLSKLRAEHHIEVDLDLGEIDLTSAESRATYDEIKAYVLEKFGLKVSSLYISQVKRKCGLEVGEHYNLSKVKNQRIPQCPPEKERAIVDALKYFQMI